MGVYELFWCFSQVTVRDRDTKNVLDESMIIIVFCIRLASFVAKMKCACVEGYFCVVVLWISISV